MSVSITSLLPYRLVAAAVGFALLVLPELALAQFTQQGPRSWPRCRRDKWLDPAESDTRFSRWMNYGWFAGCLKPNSLKVFLNHCP